ncbi:MAG: tyrosine-type recombinase/integrase [Proteobacteria bacterium]|nr:tyrosine-type recombinase/integrase [Pseudomonadota bacterium]
MRIKLDDGVTIDTSGREWKYVYCDVDKNDNVRAFLRRNGRKQRIRDWSSVDAFRAEYLKLLNGKAPIVKGPKQVAPGSMRWLIQGYYLSSEYSMLEQSTRQVRRRMLDAFSERHGDKPYKDLQATHIKVFIDEKVRAGAPEAANNLLKLLRALYGWASQPDVKHADHNPARDVKRIKTASEGHHTWTVEEVFQFEDRHPVGSKARLAEALMAYTGVRTSDAILLGPQMEREGRLHFTEFKGRKNNPKRRRLLILPELRAIIDATPSGHLNYLVTEHGKPYSTAKSFGNWFKRQCEMAGLPHCSGHGLRKAGATIAANNGTPAHALMSIYGWRVLKQADVYTREVDDMRLSDEYLHNVVPERKVDESDPLFNAVEASGSKRGKNAL